VDLLVGLGGGSCLDTAKGCNFILTNGGRMQDYRGVGKATRPMLPLIAIPTTAGTGSECQCAALIIDEATHQKMACLDPKAAAAVALLDPTLTLSQPPSVTSHTGVDALTHALETAVTRRRTAISSVFSREAFGLLAPNLPRVLTEPSDLAARGRMQLGAAFAGTAIENSMLGAAHSAANPLSARHGTTHGVAVGLMLPHVMRFNAEDAEACRIYADLAISLNPAAAQKGPREAAADLIFRIETLLNLAGIPRSLQELGVPGGELTELSDEAARQWTASFNPRPIDAEGFRRLYQAAQVPRGDCGGAS
jgi:alcohol dehydrogenase